MVTLQVFLANLPESLNRSSACKSLGYYQSVGAQVRRIANRVMSSSRDFVELIQRIPGDSLDVLF